MNSWTKLVVKWFGKGSSRKAASLVQTCKVRPVLEDLESRQLLSVTYHGGALLQHVEVETVYYGANWNNTQLPPASPGRSRPPTSSSTATSSTGSFATSPTART